MKKQVSRRGFLLWSARSVAALALLGGSGFLLRKHRRHRLYQIDPAKCTQCGRCATACVRTPSAVKCVNQFDICGYCDYCYGYYQGEMNNRELRCPYDAIVRKQVGDGVYEYTINEDKCIGCGVCVTNCRTLGNGSLYLQIRHDLCRECNQCAIADACPANAISIIQE